MKYLMFIRHSESYRNQAIPQALMDAMGEFVQESFQSGVLKDTAGLKPTKEGFRVRSSKNRLTVTDGPFSEGKEVVGLGAPTEPSVSSLVKSFVGAGIER